MNINTHTALLKLDYNSFIVAPFKYADEQSYPYRIEDVTEADIWVVLACKDNLFDVQIGQFKDQDLAHQFAELLTVCLNQVKTFTNENLQTETK